MTRKEKQEVIKDTINNSSREEQHDILIDIIMLLKKPQLDTVLGDLSISFEREFKISLEMNDIE